MSTLSQWSVSPLKESQNPSLLRTCARLPSLAQFFLQSILFSCVPEISKADASPGRARFVRPTPEAHTASSTPSYPAVQMQSVRFLLPGFEIELAGHARQTDAFKPPASGA
eukprot:1587919-Rhodomonas_salina.4